MDKLSTLAAANQQRAQEVIRDSGIESIWRSVGAEPHLVGSLRTGLLITHRDIDFHIYSSPLRVADSFAAMARLAENSRIRRIEYGNLLDTSEECLEWHAWYADADDQLWQIDMIHMPKGSAYDGYFRPCCATESAPTPNLRHGAPQTPSPACWSGCREPPLPVTGPAGGNSRRRLPTTKKTGDLVGGLRFSYGNR